MVAHASAQPTLRDLAAVASMSESHFQRTFQDWVGVSPKQFLQALNRKRSKKLLAVQSVTDTSMDVGYSSESRLFDNFVRFEGMSPAEYKQGGRGVCISYGEYDSPFGQCLIAWTKRGVCKVSFLDSDMTDGFKSVVDELSREWPHAEQLLDHDGAVNYGEQIFISRGLGAHDEAALAPSIKVWVKGTVFQVKVWEALMQIPEGESTTYMQVAESIGQPRAVRAVASAIAKNPVAFLIPCHRVIRSTGVVNDYRWGRERKIALLMQELATGCEQ